MARSERPRSGQPRAGGGAVLRGRGGGAAAGARAAAGRRRAGAARLAPGRGPPRGPLDPALRRLAPLPRHILDAHCPL